MPRLSVVMIVANEASRIQRALQSVQWADEIVVIDAFSTDQTVALCQAYTMKIFQHPWEGFVQQRRHSLEHVTHPWILSIDADEVVSESLRLEIQKILRSSNLLAGYWIPRKTNYLGRWIEHSGWFPDYQLRLFQKDRVSVTPRAVHEGFAVAGETGQLEGILYHYSFTSLQQHLDKINRYTTLDRAQKQQQLQGKRIRWYHLIFNPLSKFLRMFLVHRGFRDGFQGFLLALMSAFSTLLLYAKIWEASPPVRNHHPSVPNDPPASG
ncbi:glycosyltransferase family 2 protein [candidate division KSB1 bacterium]|nr:glycosyltransferase family 2 protein [candidate division KSB1 bacterium]